MSTIDTILTVTPIVLAVLPHAAALFGLPSWLSKIKAVQLIFDIVAGNYGLAKNLHRPNKFN